LISPLACFAHALSLFFHATFAIIAFTLLRDITLFQLLITADYGCCFAALPPFCARFHVDTDATHFSSYADFSLCRFPSPSDAMAFTIFSLIEALFFRVIRHVQFSRSCLRRRLRYKATLDHFDGAVSRAERYTPSPLPEKRRALMCDADTDLLLPRYMPPARFERRTDITYAPLSPAITSCGFSSATIDMLPRRGRLAMRVLASRAQQKAAAC